MACRRSAAEQVGLGGGLCGLLGLWPQFHKCRCSLSHPGDEPRQALQQVLKAYILLVVAWTQAVALGYSRAASNERPLWMMIISFTKPQRVYKYGQSQAAAAEQKQDGRGTGLVL